MYKVIKPNSEILRNYISEFTIFRKNDFNSIKYFALPHEKAAILFFPPQINITYDNMAIEIDRQENKSPLILVLGKYLSPLFLNYKSFVDEIAINFTPTGLNYFFEENFDEFAPNPVQFIRGNSWIEFSKKMFEKDENSRIEFLEHFLLSQLKQKDLYKIELIIEKLKKDKSLKIKDLAVSMRMSERTINRIFHRYTGCSPKDFKKITRFRSSLKMSNKELNFTKLCLNNDYYDSSHFTNEFKLLTNKSPRDFFNSMIEIGEVRYPYIFL